MSDQIIAASYGIPRSSLWEGVAKRHLLIQPYCLACGNSPMAKYAKLNVHHKFPFHYVVVLGRPDLELDQRNLYTLCVDHSQEHHILLGHLDSYESYNPWLEHHLGMFRGMLASQIRATHEWMRSVTMRPKPLKDMSQFDKNALLSSLAYLMPKVAQVDDLANPELPLVGDDDKLNA